VQLKIILFFSLSFFFLQNIYRKNSGTISSASSNATATNSPTRTSLLLATNQSSSSSSRFQPLKNGARYTHNYHLNGYAIPIQTSFLSPSSTTTPSALPISSAIAATTTTTTTTTTTYLDTDIIIWKRYLHQLLEEEKQSMVVSVGSIIQQFVRMLLQSK
jgi:hypothetical protein